MALVLIYYLLFSLISDEFKDSLRKVFLILIISSFILCLFKSCGHGIYLSGVKNGIPKDISFGNGVQKFWSVFYIPALFSLIAFGLFVLFKSLFLTLVLMFSRHPIKEAIVKREKAREYNSKKKEYAKKIGDIEIKEAGIENKLARLAKKNPEIIPEIIEHIPKDTGLYKGVFGEVARRMQEGQIKKTVVATRERIEEGKRLWGELAGLHRAKADVKRAWSEFSMVDTEIDIKERRMKARQERVGLESDVKRLELESKKLKFEQEIKKIDSEIKLVEKNDKGPSPEDRLLQSVRDNLKIMKAKGIAMEEIEKQRDQALTNIDQQKSSEIYRTIKNMYNDLLIEIMEKTKK